MTSQAHNMVWKQMVGAMFLDEPTKKVKYVWTIEPAECLEKQIPNINHQGVKA